MIRSVAHLSDLHFGYNDRVLGRNEALCREIMRSGIDHVVVTGDVTNRGRDRELAQFVSAFEPLLCAGRMTIIPGNHDRQTDDVASALMSGARVQVARPPGLYIVRVDSTGPHNRRSYAAHGVLTPTDVADIVAALDEAPPGVLRVVLMHHHPFPLPEEMALERLSTWLGYPFATELREGKRLLEEIQGRCDLLLHGHRHRPSARRVGVDPTRAFHVINAGSSSFMGSVRVLTHESGRLLGMHRCLSIGPAQVRRVHPTPSVMMMA